mmetsp:Transcript_31067/g.66133  ORF Transcript_31067/g.66133 Transcript_31067/m.66133 type:complete len:221 (-) Transcript_31067:79-741(-)
MLCSWCRGTTLPWPLIAAALCTSPPKGIIISLFSEMKDGTMWIVPGAIGCFCSADSVATKLSLIVIASSISISLVDDAADGGPSPSDDVAFAAAKLNSTCIGPVASSTASFRTKVSLTSSSRASRERRNSSTASTSFSGDSFAIARRGSVTIRETAFSSPVASIFVLSAAVSWLATRFPRCDHHRTGLLLQISDDCFTHNTTFHLPSLRTFVVSRKSQSR